MIKTQYYPARREKTEESNRILGIPIITFLILHIPLALLMSQLGMISTLHALITLAAGFMWAVQGRVERVILTAAYIMGAEVLWRMTGAGVFWEFGKYATVFILVVSMLQGRKLSPPVSMVTYFILLLPSIILTITELSLGDARGAISFNLSGPLAAMVCTSYFSNKEIDLARLKKIIWMVISPLVSIVTIAWIKIITSGNIVFSSASNFQTSGGYGPNQVSSILGLGVLLALILLLVGKESNTVRVALFAVVLAFTIEVLLTFSREGVYLVAAGIVPILLLWGHSVKERVRSMFLFMIIISIMVLIVFPYMETYTSGYFSQRFTDTGTTGRDKIIMADLDVWKDHFFFGVGPGLSGEYRAVFYADTAAHTEFSRMLSEHGLFGLAALIIFLIATIKQAIHGNTNNERAIKLGMWVFVVVLMSASAMRLVTSAFLLGIIFSTISIDRLSGSLYKNGGVMEGE